MRSAQRLNLKKHVLTLIVLFSALALLTPILAQELRSRFATLHFNTPEVLQKLVWRLTGKEEGGPSNRDLAPKRVDEITERVQTLLGMYPKDFHINIRLQPEYQTGDIAKYSHSDRTITVYADRVTEGVLAHEIAHALINSYFPVPPPRKVQEILSQYVDRHLWAE